MNVIELCLSSGLGGLELYVYHSSEALSNSKQDNNDVVAVLSENSKLDNYYKDNSKIKTLYLKRSLSALPLPNAIKLAKIIDTKDIDVIHMHWGKDLALAAFAKYFSKRKPALVYTRQMMITREKSDFYHTFLYRQMDLLLAITKELEGLCKKYIPLFADKVTTLYYGVKRPKVMLDENDVLQQRESTGFSKNDFVAGLIGRLEESKGQHLLIDALHTAKQNGHEIKALIVGHEMDAGYRDKLKDQARELDVLDNIIFQDFTSEPQQLMQLCDCVVLASAQETFGLVLPEAMRAGVAVIGSNSGGVPEIIEHEKTGLLFETKNAGSLYQQLERLYLNAGFKDELAARGKESADERFSYSLHFRKLEQHLKTAITRAS
ncbi:MAG: glycosyltransferase family 4 protein [Proteobacteria bacterium]|nr:glycosyltransferase family 4 protein [Pseudomonadota bacterium]